MADQLVAIWTRQYIRPRDIGERVHMTDERLNRVVNSAYEAGRADGELQGRVNMRKDIEAGVIDEIRRLPDA